MVNWSKLAGKSGWGIGLGLVCLVLAGCETTGSTPQFEPETQEWTEAGSQGRRILTPHFEIYSTLLDKELEATLPYFMEAAYAEYSSLLPPPEEMSRPLRSYVFANRRQWERFAMSRFPNRAGVFKRLGAGGFTVADECLVYNIRRPYTLSVLAHEGLHQYFGSHFDQTLPAWLNEGLATYCECYDFAGDKPRFTPRQNSFRLNSLRRALANDSLLPLGQMLDTNAGAVIVQGQSEKVQNYYAQAWALMDLVRHGADGKYRAGCDQLLADVAAGRMEKEAKAYRVTSDSPSSLSYGRAVFERYITTDLEAFSKDYRVHMMKACGFEPEVGSYLGSDD